MSGSTAAAPSAPTPQEQILGIVTNHFGGDPDQLTEFDVAKDSHFLIPAIAEQSSAPITTVVNWPSLLKK